MRLAFGLNKSSSESSESNSNDLLLTAVDFGDSEAVDLTAVGGKSAVASASEVDPWFSAAGSGFLTFLNVAII